MPNARISEQSKGVFIISATPFHDDGRLDLESAESLVEFYLQHRVHGMTILGMMGEAHKLSAEESADFVTCVLRRVAGRVPVIVGISNPGTEVLVTLARHAMDSGAAGVMVTAITGLRTDQHVVGYFREIGKRLGADTPLCVQDYPQTTNVFLSTEAVGQIVDEVPNFVMLKHEDFPGLAKLTRIRTQATSARRRRIAILTGNGGLNLPQELRRGADGVMTGVAFPEMLVQVWERFANGDPEGAEDLYDAYLPLVRHEYQPGIGLALRKEVLRRRGAIKSAAARHPGPSLDATDLSELDALLERLRRRLDSQGISIPNV